MISLEIKHCNTGSNINNITILTGKQKKYQHYHQAKLINMTIFQMRRY